MPRQPTVHVQMNEATAVSSGAAIDCLSFGVAVNYYNADWHDAVLIRPFEFPETIIEAAILGIILDWSFFNTALAFVPVPEGIPLYNDEPGTQRTLHYLCLGPLHGSPTYNTTTYTYTPPSSYEFDTTAPFL